MSPVLDDMFTKLLEYKQDTHYQHILTGLSLLAIVFYIVRAIQLKGWKEGSRRFITAILVLATWNLVVNLGIHRLVMYVPGVFRDYQQAKLEGPDLVRHLSVHQFNGKLVRKDMKQFMVIVEGMGVFKMFGGGIERVLNTHKWRKESGAKESGGYRDESGGFWEESGGSWEESGGSWDIKRGGSTIAKHLLQLVLLTTIFILILPHSLLLNSTAILFSPTSLTPNTNSPTFTPIVKSDHLLWALNTLFLLDTLNSIYKAPGHKSFSVVVRMFWGYSALVLITVNCLILLFHDIQINLLFVMANILVGNRQFEEYNINIFTLVVLNYLDHSYAGSQEVEVMTERFMVFKNGFSSCLVMMNVMGMVVVPFFIWICT